jgi:hypothetical protein
MRTGTIGILVIVMLTCSSCTVRMNEDLTASKVLQFGAGFGAGMLSHETGHYMVAKAEGLDNVKFRFTEVTYEGRASQTERQNFYAGGFGADILSSEVLMASNKLFPKDNFFVLGWLAWTVFEPFSYTVRNEFSSDGYGDLRGLKEAGVSPRAVEATLIAHGLLTCYRLSKNPDFPISVSAISDGFIVGAEWRF